MKKIQLFLTIITIMAGLCCVSTVSAQLYGPNLIENGDFSDGNQDFVTDYVFVDPLVGGPNSLVPEGRYTVANNPNDFHPSFSGSPFVGENFLIVNGATDLEVCGESPCDDTWIVWQQTVEVEEGKDYEFSFWLASLVTTSPAQLNIAIEINGSTFSEVSIAPGETNEWVQQSWTNTDKSETATITIIETTKVKTGNDFGIDDIMFRSIDLEPNPCPDLDVVINVTDVTCPGDEDGIIEVIMNGVKPFNICLSYGCEEEGEEFEVFDKTQTATYGGLIPGYYTITIFDGNGCPFEACVYVGEPDPLEAEIVELNNPLCYGDENGMVVMEISGGTPPYTADMGTVDGNMLTIEGLGAGVYIVEIDDSNGCGSIEVPFELEEPALLEAYFEATEILCYGGYSSVTVFASGGTPPYQLFNGDDLAGDFVDGQIELSVLAGMYLWTVVDANGCEVDVPIEIGQPDPITAEIIVSQEILCNGETGEVAVTVEGGTPPYQVIIGDYEPVMEDDTYYFTLPAGVYSVAVMDGNECSANGFEIELTEPPLLEATWEYEEIACYGEETEVTVYAMGGTPPYQLFDGDVFAGNFVDGEIALFVGAGEYLWTVTDGNGCETEVEFTLTQPDPLVATLVSTEDASCYGYEDGMAVISITGGTMPYTYDMGTFAEGLLTIDGLAAGEYTVVISDAKNCGPEEVEFEIGQPDEIVIENVDIEAPLCAPDNFPACDEPWAIDWIEYEVGFSGYNGGEVAADRQNPDNALGMPIYTEQPPISYVTLGFGGHIILEAGCLIYNGEGDDFEVVETSYGNPTCENYQEKADVYVAQDLNGDWAYLGEVCLDGSLDLSSGIDPNTQEALVFEWVQYIKIVDVSNPDDFSAGDGYDVNGIYIFNTQDPMQSASYIEIEFSGVNDGEEIEFVIYEGDDVVSISNTAELSGLPPGDYTVILQVGDCFSEPFEFTVPEAPEPIVATADVTDVLCNGGNTGTALITVSGGTPPYTLEWEGLEEVVTIEEDGGSYLITGLSVGTYVVTIIDDHACIGEVSFDVGEPEMLTVAQDNGEILCFEGTTWVSLDIQGGVEPYLLSDNNSDFELEIDEAGETELTGFAYGDYSWTVTDANGCAVLVEFFLDQPEELTAEVAYDPIACFGWPTDVTVTAMGGEAPYMLYNMEVSEDNLVVESFDLSVTLFELASGDYVWIVVDDNGCEFTLEFEIEQPDEFTADYILDPESILCHNGVTTALISAQGGTTPYFLTLGEGNVIEFTDEYIVEDVAPGFYSWTVTDANECVEISIEFELENPDEIVLNVESLTDITCYGYDDGEIHATAFGGTGMLSFSLNGGEPQASGSFYNLFAGVYEVTVTDENGCFVTETVTLEEPDELVIDVYDIVPSDFGENNGEIWALISGGTGPYNVCLFTECTENDDEEGEMYNKSQGVMYWNLEPGEYMIKVVDANGCTAYECVVVPEVDKNKIVDSMLTDGNTAFSDDVNLTTYPNPFRSQTTIEFTPQTSQYVTLEVYNLIGERVEVLFQGHVNAFEKQKYTFSAGHLPNGIYYVRLGMDAKIHYDKIILAK